MLELLKEIKDFNIIRWKVWLKYEKNIRSIENAYIDNNILPPTRSIPKIFLDF